MTKVDDHTVEITTTRPTPRLSIVLGSVIYGNPFHVVPKHIWEQQDPATFTNFPPVTISAYKFKDADPNGTWFLWEKREDWQNSDVGQMIGEPQPDYVLFRSYGTEERRVLAMAADDMDILTDISPESLDILRKQNPKVRAWFTDFPYANLDDPCERGIHFNTSDRALRRRQDPLGAGAGDRPAAGEHRHLLGHAARLAARHAADHAC